MYQHEVVNVISVVFLTFSVRFRQTPNYLNNSKKFKYDTSP